MRPPRLPQAENGWGLANGRYGESSRLFPNEMSRREAFCSTEMDGSTQCVCRVGLYEDREPDQERVWKSAGELGRGIGRELDRGIDPGNTFWRRYS